jgi:hypothetical protein
MRDFLYPLATVQHQHSCEQTAGALLSLTVCLLVLHVASHAYEAELPLELLCIHQQTQVMLVAGAPVVS